MTVPNNGNLIMRRAFFEDEKRRKILQKVTNVAWSTVSQHMEEVPPNGSGSPSCLHMLQELIRRLDEKEKEEGCEISMALELSVATLNFYRQLQAEGRPAGDAKFKLAYLNKYISDALFLLNGKELKDAPLGELKELWQLLMNAATSAQEACTLVEAQIREAEGSYPGAPIQRERVFKVAG